MDTVKLFGGILLAAFVVVIAGCQEEPAAPTGLSGGGLAPAEETDPASQLASFMDVVNATLDEKGADYRVVMAEAITAAESGEAGIEVIAKHVGNKQLGFDFVPGDVRRGWSGADPNTIDYAIDTTGDAVPVFGPLGAAQTDAAIVRGHNSWEALNCSFLGQARNPDFGIDIGVVADILSGGIVGSPFVFADVQHAGWRDLDFAGGVLGVTYTFGFCDPCSGPDFAWTDIDGNGVNDAAFREIYYDPSWAWYDDGTTNMDVESVAVHEIGHGLSQAHFGMVFIKNNGSLFRSPLAVMNAIYSMPFRVLQGNDNGGHCSNWAEWPNN